MRTEWGQADCSTLLGMKVECTQRSISLVSSPWGSPQITTCPEAAQIQRAEVPCFHSCTQEEGTPAHTCLRV